jgi:hypothetical protein
MIKRFFWVLLPALLLTACLKEEEPVVVSYVATGTTARVDVAFFTPPGVETPADDAFPRGDSTYVRGDTTFVVNVARTWRHSFEAKKGDSVWIRVTNRSNRSHVSSIIYRDDQYMCSKGSADPFGVAVCEGKL